MEYQNYDDYMRSILGYSVPSVPNFSQRNLNTNMYSSSNMFQSNSNLERMYPDTYRAVYPIIVSTSNMVTLPITEEMLDRMVDDIYDKVETNGIININVEFGNRDDSKLREKTDISKSDVTVVESAILIGSGIEKRCHELWFVYCEREERIRRLISSRGYSRQKAIDIINSQPDDDEYNFYADEYIDNSSTPSSTMEQIDLIMNREIC